MDFEAIRQLSQTQMQQVDKLITTQLKSDVALINQLGLYIINSGGKRMRPLLVTLAANALNTQNERHIKLAAVIEFIHTSTLLHDDVVDESMLRRGKETANAVFGNSASVLVGDFLYTRSFQLMTDIGSLELLGTMANATNVLAEGEVMQLMNCNNADITEADYMQTIYCKTAKLFEVATELGALLAEADKPTQQAMADYGKHLGLAFQIIDDVLDYTSDADTLGKNIGDDLAEGKPTLPLIHALHNTNGDIANMIKSAIENADGSEHMAAILEAMRACGSIDYCNSIANDHANQAIEALNCLPDSPYKSALVALANIAVRRDH